MIPLCLRRGAGPRPPHLCGQDPQGRAVRRHRDDRPGGPRAHGADHNGRRAALADRSRRALAALSRGRGGGRRRSVGRRSREHWGRGARRAPCRFAVGDRAGGCVVAAAGGEAPRGLRRHARIAAVLARGTREEGCVPSPQAPRRPKAAAVGPLECPELGAAGVRARATERARSGPGALRLHRVPQREQESLSEIPSRSG